MDLTGHWQFFERFEFGFDVGIAVFKQIDLQISGTIVYSEYINEDPPFIISVDITGEVLDDRVIIRGKSYEIIESNGDIEYELDDRIGFIENDEDIIVGKSIDDQNLMGDFVLKRIDRLKKM
ncbi:hypothetical protein DMA11_01395 [Marinilabiliaceae bacterium JC017]|nr:hypothetical protein DMA11_01395 [Marinilabiliaceae bacterium JC017]